MPSCIIQDICIGENPLIELSVFDADFRCEIADMIYGYGRLPPRLAPGSGRALRANARGAVRLFPPRGADVSAQTGDDR